MPGWLAWHAYCRAKQLAALALVLLVAVPSAEGKGEGLDGVEHPECATKHPDWGVDRLFFENYDHHPRRAWKWLHYLPLYTRHLRPYRHRPGVRFLEVGVLGAGDEVLFHKYLGPCTVIVGLDIEPLAARLACPPRFLTVVGSQGRAKDLRRTVSVHGPFDLVLDDGSHIPHHIILTAQTLLPLLRRGGTYLIEDLVGRAHALVVSAVESLAAAHPGPSLCVFRYLNFLVIRPDCPIRSPGAFMEELLLPFAGKPHYVLPTGYSYSTWDSMMRVIRTVPRRLPPIHHNATFEEAFHGHHLRAGLWFVPRPHPHLPREALRRLGVLGTQQQQANQSDITGIHTLPGWTVVEREVGTTTLAAMEDNIPLEVPQVWAAVRQRLQAGQHPCDP